MILIILYLCLIYPPWIRSNLVSQTDFMKGDSFYYRAIIISLLQDGDLLLDNNVPVDSLNGQLALGTQGLVPKHPIILSLVSLPFYQVFGGRGLLIFNILNCIILALLIFKLNQFFFNDSISFLTTLLYATATLFFNYVYNYSPDVFSTMLVLAGLNLVLRRMHYWGALVLGLSVFAKLPNLPLAGVILIYASLMILRGCGGLSVSRQNLVRRCAKVACMAIFFLLALLPFGFVNHLLFGSPFVTGYQRTAEKGPTAGEIVISDHVNKFNQPFLSGALRLLLNADSGLIPTNPILIIAILGFFHLGRSIHPLSLYLIVILCMVQLITFAKYDDWQTSEFSNRFLMTLVACSSVFTSAYFQFLRKRFLPSAVDGSAELLDSRTA